ncbi:MAG: hypothetical protein NWP87_00200 [Winogradskyella sp.]|nr:hypothetical protein [Winogradskyella sp.]
MELVVNQELEFVREPIELPNFTTQGLLNSNYKSVVKQNFSSPIKTSVFGIRQRVKALQYYSINHTAVILKLALFALFLIVLF